MRNAKTEASSAVTNGQCNRFAANKPQTIQLGCQCQAVPRGTQRGSAVALGNTNPQLRYK